MSVILRTELRSYCTLDIPDCSFEQDTEQIDIILGLHYS